MMRAALGVALLACLALGDVAVRRDGSILRAEMDVLAGKGRLVHGKSRNREESLRAFYLVEKEDGTHVWSPSTAFRARGYVILGKTIAREKLAELVKQALKARDDALARRLLDRAVEFGLEDKKASGLEARVEKLAAKPRKPDPELVPPIVAAAGDAEALVPALLVDRAAAAFAVPDHDTAFILLREAFRLDPESKAAKKLLDGHGPKGFPLGDDRAWVDWRLEIQRHGFQQRLEETLELKRARHHWRPDLYAVGDEEIYLVTAIRNYALVGRCLRQGRLVCRALASLFPTDQPVQRERGPLTVFLYMDKKAYKKHAGDYRKIDDPSFLDWSTGHWSERDDISRFYWPTDPDDERRLLFVFRREITRHWMHARNPRYSVSEASGSWRQPGFWLERGLLAIIAQGRFDPGTGSWDLFNPRCKYLDAVEGLSRQQSGKLHPWSAAYSMSGREAFKLSGKKKIRVVRRWSLSRWSYSAYHVYLAQAGATCQYLFHGEEGRHRKALLEAIVAHFKGEAARADPQAAFGLSPAQLGQKTVEFAGKVASGWRPEGP